MHMPNASLPIRLILPVNFVVLSAKRYEVGYRQHFTTKRVPACVSIHENWLWRCSRARLLTCSVSKTLLSVHGTADVIKKGVSGGCYDSTGVVDEKIKDV